MYELVKSPFGPHTLFDLFNPQSGNRLRIVPGKGATVLDLQFGGQSVLDGYTTPKELEEGKWGKSSILFPFPNRLKDGRYTWKGKKYQFPINNASTGNAIHGFVREESFEVDYVFLAQTSASIRCYYDYSGDRPYYPFPFSLEVEFTLHDSGKLEMQVEVLNLHDGPIPLGFGWHPYFRLTEGANAHSLRLPACEKVEIDSRMIPSGGRSKYQAFNKLTFIEETVLDNCFQYSNTRGQYQLMLEGEGRYLTVKSPAGQFPFFQVFTPPHRESVALEPMSCNVDAFNNEQGLVRLEADEKWKGKVVVECTMQ